MAMSATSPLPPIRRIVTGHNDQAQAIVVRDDLIQGKLQSHGTAASLLWSTDSFPADVNSKEDKATTQTGLVNNGSVLRIVDIPPRSVGTLHRTISLDYIVVLKGTVALTLDDGSKTPMSEGSVVVQQATMHGWDNDSDEWARILCTLARASPPVVSGVELEPYVTFTVK